MSMKNSNDTIGNRTRDLLTCSAVSCCVTVVKFKEFYSVLYTQTLKEKCKWNTEYSISVQNVCGRNFPCSEVLGLLVYAHGAATTHAGRRLKYSLFVTNFTENWQFDNFVETFQCTITRKLFNP